jgi:hypothetical protein
MNESGLYEGRWGYSRRRPNSLHFVRIESRTCKITRGSAYEPGATGGRLVGGEIGADLTGCMSSYLAGK